MTDTPAVAVLGAGSWGTAFSNLLAHRGFKITLWARRPELAGAMAAAGENSEYLPGVALSKDLVFSGDLQASLRGAAIVVMAVPSPYARQVLHEAAPFVPREAKLVSLTKGLEMPGMSWAVEVIAQELQPEHPERIAVVAGPNLAREIAAGFPAASVVGCADGEVADYLSELLQTPFFRTYTSPDVIGVEVGSVVKNVVAIAAGAAEGLGFGDNAKASVMTRGLAEMGRLGVRLGADPLTFLGLSGVGDLICTCMSPLSRNHRVGVELGTGRAIKEILAGSREVAEGVPSSKSLKQLATQHGVRMPISDAVYQVIHEGRSVDEALIGLLPRVSRREHDFG